MPTTPEERQAVVVENILAGRVCGRCKHRAPVLTAESDGHGGVNPRSVLVCGLDSQTDIDGYLTSVQGLTELDPDKDSCARFSTLSTRDLPFSLLRPPLGSR